ncbi:hypothetical protein, partial [Mesorhizobium sp.]|uniref:hypothetical protein n=1 Tax=Mesorhizobium sp. TaxID=1871066 RepID=UPI0025DFBEF8
GRLGGGGVRHGISLDGMPAGRRFSFVAAVSYHGGPKWSSPMVVTDARPFNAWFCDAGFSL